MAKAASSVHMPEDREIWRGVDHANRGWLVTARPFHFDTQLVTFVCRSQRGTKALDQTGAWHPDTGWDMTRWFPASPRPVPSLVLAKVMSALREVEA